MLPEFILIMEVMAMLPCCYWVCEEWYDNNENATDCTLQLCMPCLAVKIAESFLNRETHCIKWLLQYPLSNRSAWNKARSRYG